MYGIDSKDAAAAAAASAAQLGVPRSSVSDYVNHFMYISQIRNMHKTILTTPYEILSELQWPVLYKVLRTS